MTGLTILLGATAALAGSSPWASPAPGEIHLGAHSGFPWHGVHAEYAPRGPVALTGQVRTALFRRTEARIGLQRPWDLSKQWSVLTSISAGGVYQVGGVPRQGPQVAGRLSLSRRGRLEPYLSLHDQELFALESVEIQSGSGEETTRQATRYSSRGGSLGLRIPVQSQWCIDLAITAGPIDSEFAIPSLSAGFNWRPEP